MPIKEFIPQAFRAPVNLADLESKYEGKVRDLHRFRFDKLVTLEHARKWDQLLVFSQTYTNMVAEISDLWDEIQTERLREKGLI